MKQAILLLLGAAAASANTLVTFQVDMSAAIAGGTFDPNTQTVAARGTFNDWTAFTLTNNPAGPNPALYTGTFNVQTNGSVMQYRYTIDPGGNYETVLLAGAHNRLVTLPSTTGASLLAPKVYYGDNPPAPVTTPVTFRVDMAQQINAGAFNTSSSLVYTRGYFNGWVADIPMTNDPAILVTNQFGLVTSNVYVMTYDLTYSPGATIDFKHYFDPGGAWESPGLGVGDPQDNNNRFFNLAESPQRLPIVYFSDSPYAPVATNAVIFQVDMTAQTLFGAFDPSVGTVELRGSFNNWGGTLIVCTNDPGASNTNLYKAVVTLADGIGAQKQYKFWASVPANGGWELPDPNVTPLIGGNRFFSHASTSPQILPPVFFSDQNPGDFLAAATLVTFTVNMTNAVGTDADVFDPTTDRVFLNGIPSFLNWDGATLAAYELTNNPVGSRMYSIELPVPAGTVLRQTYKYSINGPDNEAGQNQNHVRFIRTTGTYAMPADTFGNQLVEPSFGDLKARVSAPGRALISWLGRSGVRLQSRSGVSSGPWVDHPATDGLSSTNWPTATGPLFFRLINPSVP